MKNALILFVVLSAAALAAAGVGCAKDEPQAEPRNGPPSPSAVSPSVGTVAASAASGQRNEPATPEPVRGREQFVGSVVCASCHQAEGHAFLTSHHAKALVQTSSEPHSDHLSGARFVSKYGGTTTFTVRGGVVTVNTPTAKGKSVVLPTPFVSGVWPLQQYVVETERGKLQALGVVWDSRDASLGGNRWFHVNGREGIAPNDPLFFTHATQNWNHMCADCHSTWVARGYDATNDSFDTKWAELAVGCEACHGPGAPHVESARLNPQAVVKLAAELKPAEPWAPSVTGSPTPRTQRGLEVEACSPCHSRRAPLAEGFIASDILLDHFEPELLWPGRYHADGQVEGEVYEWGSFTQSRMYQAGVTCSDCHNPHSGKPYASGDALCGRCHEATRFQSPDHSHHTGASAPQCVDCHMPSVTFMQIDERRDHSIRIPRPDHSVAFGTPNPCNTCHAKQGLTWARDWTRRWYPKLEERAHFVDAIGKERQGAPDAPRALRKLALDITAPAIARATALERLGNFPSPQTLATLRTVLDKYDSPSSRVPKGSDAVVAFGAVLGATALALPERVALLLPSLHHEVRAVRIAAGKALARVPKDAVPANARERLDRVLLEVEESYAVNASRAETHVERSALELARGSFVRAEAALQTALALEPCLNEAHLNLAELMRQRNDEVRAERAIAAALACDPKSAATHHALGLLYVRTKRPADALESLKKAVALAPADTRFSYVLAVALAGAGKTNDAVRVLEASLVHHPNDIPTLQVLSRYLEDLGANARASVAAERLRRLLEE